MAKHKGFSQYYIAENKPSGNSAKDLFVYCVENVIASDLFSQAYMHNQWANLLFKYEKNSDTRIDLMSKVKREYATYFTHTMKYTFDEEKIRRDFPYLFGIDEDEDDYTTDSLIRDTIRALNKEIAEQNDPQNIESFKGEELTLVRQQGKSYIYQIRITVNDGQEPNFHESTPFILKVYDKEVTSPLQSVRLARLLRSRLKKKLNLLKFWGLPN